MRASLPVQGGTAGPEVLVLGEAKSVESSRRHPLLPTGPEVPVLGEATGVVSSHHLRRPPLRPAGSEVPVLGAGLAIKNPPKKPNQKNPPKKNH